MKNWGNCPANKGEKKMKKLEAIKEIIKKQEKIFDFNDYILNHCAESDIQEIEDENDLENYLNKINEDMDITSAEVIYYANAIKYLAENDQSLNESIDIAIQYGYDLNNINSELLASLLKSQNNLNDYYLFIENCVSEFTSFLAEYEDEEDEEEEESKGAI